MTLRAPLQTRIERRASTQGALNSQAAVTRNSLLTILKNQDRFFGPAGSGPDYDFQNPRAKAFPVALRTWTGNLAGSALQAAVPAAKPFAADPWPNPGRRTHVLMPRFWRSPLGAGAAPPAVLPPAAYDFPNPRGRRSPVALLTWVESLKLNLIGQDAYGQFVQVDSTWQRVPTIGLRTWTNNLLQTTLAPFVPPPFDQSDWPVPRGKQAAIALRTWIDATKLQLLGQDTFFTGPGCGPEYDWPNPRGRVSTAHRQGWEQNLLGTTLAPLQAAPFSQQDWPVPGQKRANQRGSAQGQSLWQFQANPVPFSFADWTVPKARARSVELITFTVSSPTYVGGQHPFAQADWPVPKGRPPLVNTFIHGFRAYYDAPALDTRVTFEAIGFDDVYFYAR